jgi:hypothetical protein
MYSRKIVIYCRQFATSSRVTSLRNRRIRISKYPSLK